MATYGNKNIRNFYQQLEIDERAHFERSVEKASKLAAREMMQVTERDLREKFRESVEEFYADYTPSGNYPYQRNYSLYDILDMEYLGESAGYENGALSLSYDDSKATQFRKGGGSVYELAFKEGWHGGAKSGDVTRFSGGVMNTPHPNPGTPYYRHMIKSRKHGKWFSVGWTRPAERTEPSPLDKFNSEIDVYVAEKMQPVYTESFSRHFNEIIREGW